MPTAVEWEREEGLGVPTAPAAACRNEVVSWKPSHCSLVINREAHPGLDPDEEAAAPPTGSSPSPPSLPRRFPFPFPRPLPLPPLPPREVADPALALVVVIITFPPALTPPSEEYEEEEVVYGD